MKSGLARAALVLAAVVLTLLVAEQVLRLAGVEYRPMTIRAQDPEEARFHHLLDDRHFVYDADLIWKPRAGFEPFNEQGFRGPVLPAEKPPGTARVFALGDSNTLGWAGEDGANWPADLQRLLAGSRYQVVNAGVWGYSSFQGLGRLQQILDHQPDVVLISFGSNDAHLVPRPDREFARDSRWSRGVRRALERSRLGQLALGGWDRLARRDEAGRVHRVGLDEYRANLEAMVRQVREAGGRPVLLTRPFFGAVRSETWWKNFAPSYNLATAEVAESTGTLLIDIYSFFKYRDELFSDESHFNDEGHRLAARIVLEHLQPLLFAPAQPPRAGAASR